ncbi:uncharacterized protein CPUR_04310 [Claviceps purpurea 20.1]|uniref:Uncharacterized protein n=1 Tax=Claviceps purpurea (strain 20.1) TaxID=1111077 RepID=M1VW11_CLAP2|nr:uncharacterized protein CPUR_04310 [Claviceps purpurea 20.1]
MIGDDEFWRQLRAAEARALEVELDYNGPSTCSQTQAREQVVVIDAVNRLLKRSVQDPTLRETFGIAADAKVSFDDFLDGQWCSYETPDVGLEPVLHVLWETGLDGEIVIELSHVMDKSHQTGDVFVSESRRLAAAAITQLYAAMIQKRVRFGYIDTGEVKVFLRIGEDPSLVEYYLTIPSRDVEAEGDAEQRLVCISHQLHKFSRLRFSRFNRQHPTRIGLMRS